MQTATRPVFIHAPLPNGGFEIDLRATQRARRTVAALQAGANDPHLDPADTGAELEGDDVWFGWHYDQEGEG